LGVHNTVAGLTANEEEAEADGAVSGAEFHTDFGAVDEPVVVELHIEAVAGFHWRVERARGGGATAIVGP